ncbi:MAG TPA: hypothetical protein VN939_01145 [Chthoniobacterales bacterium]|nr:hypothetical protein [Chthoniobacterales bacterium]
MGDGMDHRSILIGADAVAKILAFIKTRPQGVTLTQLVTKYQLVSEDTILAAISILEEYGAINLDREAGFVVCIRPDPG